MRYNAVMALPIPKWAVYYGTITLLNGDSATFTAAEVAELYGVEGEDYLEVPLTGPYPFMNGQDELSYYHLKPLRDGRYYDAPTRYNVEVETQWDEDFDARINGKWAVRPQTESDEDIG